MAGTIIYLFLVFLITVLIFKRQNSDNFYGPKSHPIIGCMISFWKNQIRLCEWYTELLRNSPTQTMTIQRLGGTRTVVTANPENVEHILKNRFENYPKGKIFNEILNDLLGNGIFNADGEAWRIQRKIASYEFSTKSLRNFIVDCVQSETADRLIPVLEQACKRGTLLDLQDVLRRFSFDNICKVAFGNDPNLLDLGLPRSEFADAMDVACQLSSKRARAVISLEWKFKRALKLGSEKDLASAIHVVDEFAGEIIKRRSAEIGNSGAQFKPDLLSRFLLLTEETLDHKHLRDIVVSFVLAGRDTTAAALTWFFWLISSHPEVEERILRELGERKEGSLSYEDVKGMEYLHSAICESMRLYPPVRYDSKHALEDDCLPDGTFVKKGSWVTYHPYAMGRMKSIWGEDCMEFRPERWIKDGIFVPQSPFKYAVFQAGARVCLGKEMAFIQMKYIAASVIRGFRLRVDPLHRGDCIPSLTSTMKNGLPVLVQKRAA